MTAPTTGHAKDTVVKVDDAAGSLTALTAYVNTAEHERETETDGATVKGTRAEDMAGGLAENGELGWEGPFSSTLCRHMAGIWMATAQQTVELDPIGTDTGRRKFTAESILTELSFKGDIGSTGSMSGTHKISGDLAYAAN